MDNEKTTLEKMSIYDLRQLGRQVGVKSPSSLRKNQLITEIYKINVGLAEPYRAKRGRPNKDTRVYSYEININSKKLAEIEKLIDDFKADLITLLCSSD